MLISHINRIQEIAALVSNQPNYTLGYLLGGDKGLHGVGHDKGQVLGRDKEQLLGHELGHVTLLGEGLGHGMELEHGKVLELGHDMELGLGHGMEQVQVHDMVLGLEHDMEQEQGRGKELEHDMVLVDMAIGQLLQQ